MNNAINIGIDAGKEGAFAIFQNTDLYDIIDMPLIRDNYSNKIIINIIKIRDIIQGIIAKNGIVRLYLEFPEFSVKQSNNQSLYMAYHYGINLGMLDSLFKIYSNMYSGVSYHKINVQKWKHYYNLIGKGKESACIKATSLYQGFAESFIEITSGNPRYYDGRAESVLIGKYGIESISISR